MAGYYVAKGNRCGAYHCGSCYYNNCSSSSSVSENDLICIPECYVAGFLEFAVSSSEHSQTRSGKIVHFSETQLNTQKKGVGNRVKRGSGGNSYAAYLAKKRGKLSCC